MLDKFINSDLETKIINCILRRDLTLWIFQGASEESIHRLINVPWTNIWNENKNLALDDIFEQANLKRSTIHISKESQNFTDFRPSEMIRVYDIFVSPEESLRKKREIDRLIDSIEADKGLICFVGPCHKNREKIHLINEIAPFATKIILNENNQSLKKCESILTSLSIDSFTSKYRKNFEFNGQPEYFRLKDAEAVRIAPSYIEDISKWWTSLNASLTTPPQEIHQNDFDDFLNGLEAWEVYSTHGAYLRISKNTQGDIYYDNDLYSAAIKKINELQHADSEHNNNFKQLIIFAEPGSGVTTLIRQTAMMIAQDGFPTIVSKPSAKNINNISLERFIIEIQDQWRKQRKGKGSGKGTLPVCVFVDSDNELSSPDQGLAKSLQNLNRKILLIKAYERSDDEVKASSGVYKLTSEISKKELINIANHIRVYSAKYKLAGIPTNEEWDAYHEGISKITRYSERFNTSAHSTPFLFLIGINPFIKDRIYDENSLEQYYYKKWNAITDPATRHFVSILAAAGTYGVGVPFDALRRHPEYDILQLAEASKEDRRLADMFVRWDQNGINSNSWYLHIRHAAIATLLSRSIDPYGGEFPYTQLIPIVQRLTNKEEDIWFAENIAFRLGKNFKSKSGRFNLDTDTAVQRAARELFNAIPHSIKTTSRTVLHHEGIYHLHLLRSCEEYIKHPELTSMHTTDVYSIARKEFDTTSEILEIASSSDKRGEPVSNIYNTLALAHFTIADILEEDISDTKNTFYTDGLKFEEKAIAHDPANGHALFQYINRLHKLSDKSQSITTKTDLIIKAEEFLAELTQLYNEKRWRNIDYNDAEIQIHSTIEKQLSLCNEVDLESPVKTITNISPETRLILESRRLQGTKDINKAFLDPQISVGLRTLRSKLVALPNRSARTDIYLYKLFINDPQGRYQFDNRISILEELKTKDYDLFLPYRHDEAALFCQIGRIDIGNTKFKQIRESKRANSDQWIWLNERALTDNEGNLESITFEVIDKNTGKCRIRDTNIVTRYQPYQFRHMENHAIFTAHAKFTLNGLLATPKKP